VPSRASARCPFADSHAVGGKAESVGVGEEIGVHPKVQVPTISFADVHLVRYGIAPRRDIMPRPPKQKPQSKPKSKPQSKPQSKLSPPRKPAPLEVPAVVLPGEREEDHVLIDQVVQYVNGVHAVKTLEVVREIGEYLITTFFSGDPENFHSHGRKHASFRKLADRDDLNVSYAWLWNACAVVDQLRLLPEDIRGSLPYTHQRLLLTVKEPDAKVRLARKAVKEGLSKRVFATEVQKTRDRKKGESQAGRPPLPEFAKGFTRLKAAVELATSKEVTADAVEYYKPDKTRALLKDLEDQIESLLALSQQITGAIAEWEKRGKGALNTAEAAAAD
jgi:hypothetical protein